MVISFGSKTNLIVADIFLKIVTLGSPRERESSKNLRRSKKLIKLNMIVRKLSKKVHFQSHQDGKADSEGWKGIW